MLKKIAEKMGADSDAESYHKTVSNTGSSCNIDCNQKYNTALTGSVATAVITNTSGGARYYTNGIYKSSSSGATSGGICLKGSSGSLGNNKSNTITTSIADCAHAYARGSIYKTADYASGVKSASATILK